MSRREGKRPRSRSNSPRRRGDRDEDRKPYKSSRSDRPRSRSPTPDRDRRSRGGSDSRRHSDRRSRSRSPHRSRDSRHSGSDRRSDRSERTEKVQETKPVPVAAPAASVASVPSVAPIAPASIESLLEEVAPAATEALTAKRAAEQAVLEEDIRKRREKVNAWREAKRLQQEAEARASAPSGESNGSTDAHAGAVDGGDNNGDVAMSTEATESHPSLTPAAAHAETEIEDANHGWSLENDDEEEAEEGGAPLSQPQTDTATDLTAPASPLHTTAEEDTDSVFKNLASPAKAAKLSTIGHTNPLANVTAVSLAAAVTGITDDAHIVHTSTGTGGSVGGAVSSNSTAGTAATGANKRFSRLKSSKWDSGDVPVSPDTTTNTTTTTHSTTTHPTTTTTTTHPTTTTAHTTLTSDTAAMELEEEIDPLEAFMSSLYDTGDVAEQKTLEKKGPAQKQVQVITMEDILAGNVPGDDTSSANGSRKRGGVSFANTNTSSADTHTHTNTPPSPVFAPSLNTYPSSASLMSKSPSLRTLALNASTSFDNLNRGWESDAGDVYVGTAAGGSGSGNVDAMDIEDDNGEVPWHLMSSTEKQHHNTNTHTTTNTTNVNTAYTSESETDPEYPNETPAERESRELREKAEFIDAIRRARAEEDQVRERLEKSDRSSGGGNVGNKGSSGGVNGPSSTTVAARSNGAALGRVFAGEGDMIEEYEIESKRRSALEIMDEARKGKMLREIDHSKVVYLPFRKNLYIMPRALSRLSEADVLEKREDLQIKVRGKACPVPVDSWEQCGLSDRVLQTVTELGLKEPFAIQKQAIPAIMCGRDVIGVAKTGSGKTLAFLLPMLRHILDQPPLLDGEGPIGLVMAPARELALQIFQEAKKFTKPLGLRATCIYGGAGVAEQIADLKRGSEIVVCTPGRMIDILCMQAGKLVSLKRVTMVVMDEADRMFDMGFEPQIKMIIQNVRPDRQTVLFSATFPKQIEKLAKTVLRVPLEIVVGERSTVNKDITQVIEVHDEEDKFLRLLQLLGVWYEKGSVLIFVDKQEKCDQLFQDLLKLGYPCLSLHGGKDQVDRDHTLHEFKTGVKTVMVATSVAGRGLDVPDIICVVNYHCPNHIEDYVHRVGRTGRAGRKGTAYTFVSAREDQYAPSMVKVLQKAGQQVPQELLDLAAQFRQKVARGEATWVSSGFEGKGFTFDASEMNETQKVASMQKRAYEKDQGLDTGADADDEDDDLDEAPLSATPKAAAAGAAGAASATASTSSTAGTSPVPIVPVFTPDMTPLDRAKALAAAMAANRAAGIVPTGSIAPAPTGPIDPQAALARARLVALQMGAAGKAGAAAEDHYSEELEINDYPHQARRKVTNKSSLDDITDRTGVAIISRGAFVPPGKKLEPGERRLHLIIQGTNEMSVRQAKLEIMKVLEDETIRISASGSLATSGRYSVI